ncbi:MAG: 6,7-dimethyl-8-ribityllumazine synthase [Candidatus Altiarchaeales archaeon ex4484_96]|nr:MAG: 6,7-dimethyl-8-ribityllumazine synthase [Candidatus Altiarchaeales archaeon ex4484_96]
MARIRLGIVGAEFNYEVTYAMMELAKEHARFLDAAVVSVVKVPGVFDMPLAVKRMLDKDNIDAVVALGAVIEGKTQHDEIVAQHASRKISDLSLEYGKPVGLGIAGPGMSRLEAYERVEYAKRAVESAVKMCKLNSKEGGYRKETGYRRKRDYSVDEDDDDYDSLPNVGSFMEVG